MNFSKIKVHYDNITDTLSDRGRTLLETRSKCDCSFHISGTIIKAHKLFLSMSSPVFEAMFYGPLSDEAQNIFITDIEPEVFQLLLNYIYTDRVAVSSIEQAFGLLYASNKYMVDSLLQLCVDHILSNLHIESVITILNYSHYMQHDVIEKSALDFFCKHAKHLLQKQKSLITCNAMKIILNCDDINIHEADLIKHIFQWTEYHCEQHDIPDTFENRRNVLIDNGLFALLRFGVPSPERIDEIFNDECNLLLAEEVVNIKNKVDDGNGIIQINQRARYPEICCNGSHWERCC